MLKAKENKGLYLALVTAVISGISLFTAKFALGFAGSPTVYTTAKNLVVGLLAFGTIITLRQWPELLRIKKVTWFKLTAIAIIGGSLPFILFFEGLSRTSAINGAFLHKTLFIWVALLSFFWLKEKIGRAPMIGLLAMLVGIYFLNGLKDFSLSQGELLILIATGLWAIEYILAKILLKEIKPNVVIWARMFLGSLILLAYLAWQGQLQTIWPQNGNQWLWLLIPAILLSGYVYTWYYALYHARAVLVTSILTLGFPITILLNNFFVKNTADINQVMGIFILMGGFLLVLQIKNRRRTAKSLQPI